MLVGSTGENSSYYHGNDGLGDVPDPSAPDLSNVQNEHAVLALIRLVNQHAGNFIAAVVRDKFNVNFNDNIITIYILQSQNKS